VIISLLDKGTHVTLASNCSLKLCNFSFWITLIASIDCNNQYKHLKITLKTVHHVLQKKQDKSDSNTEAWSYDRMSAKTNYNLRLYEGKNKLKLSYGKNMSFWSFMSLNHKIDILNKLDIFGAINLNHKKELWRDIKS